MPVSKSAGPLMDVELGHRGRLLAVRRPEAVDAGVATADDHHVPAAGVDLTGTVSPRATRLACGR